MLEFGKLKVFTLEDSKKFTLRVNEIIGKIKSNLVSKNIVRMRESQRFITYSNLKSNILVEKYLNSNIAWSKIKLITQLRINSGQYTVRNRTIKLNNLLYFYKKI